MRRGCLPRFHNPAFRDRGGHLFLGLQLYLVRSDRLTGLAGEKSGSPQTTPHGAWTVGAQRVERAVAPMKFVRDDGSLAARIVGIGEAPGEHEEAQGRPFIGPAGKILTRWWQEVGLSRQDMYLTNVCPRRPNDRNEIEAVPAVEMASYVDQLHNRIAALTNPRILVPQGNVALQALLGFSGITKHRGYFYEYTDRRGRKLTVIPTIHPAATMYQAGRKDSASIFEQEKKAQRSWAARCILDWKRIKEEAALEQTVLPERKQYILPKLDDVRWLRNHVVMLPADAILALDVETPRNRIETVVGETKTGKPKVEKTWADPYLACIGFSFDPAWSMTIPTTVAYWKSQERWAEVRELLRQILMSRCSKGTQNGLFDWFHCYFWLDVWPVNWRWDSLAQDHQRDPIEQHSLEFQASIHIKTTYWKDEAKEADEITQVMLRDRERFYAYNGKDAHHTREIIEVHCGRNDLAWYDQHYRSLFLPLLDMMVRGIRVSDSRRRLRLAQLTAQAITLRANLTTLAGEDLYAEKAISPKKLTKFLYETLGLPAQKVYDHKKRTQKITTKEVAIRRLAIKYPTQFGAASECILGARRVAKQREFYDDSLVDPDGYTRCQYGLTETLRLKSWANPMRRGRNHQNFDRECRDHLLPDEGHVWLEPDASQIESRICYAMTGDAHLIELARRHPADYDDHSTNAAQMLGIPLASVGFLERHVGKIGAHAAQRDMKGPTLADTLLKELGIVRAPEECQGYIDRYFKTHPAIKDYFREVRHRVIHERKLTNSWGFTIYLDHEPLDEALYRRGYSFFMQSENGMNTNYLGLVPTWWWLKANKMHSRVLQQGHDSLPISAAPDEAYDVMCQVQSTWEVPRVYWGTELTVPICWKIGTAMGKPLAEFKRFPTRAQVEEVVQRCLS